MTLLTAVQDAQRLLSLPVTSLLVSEGQETQNLLYVFAKQEARDILDRQEYEFPSLRRTKTFTATTGATLQTDGLASDFHRAIDETFWNRTQHKKVFGPLNDQEWGIANGASVSSATWASVMFRYDGLHIYPAPAAADTIAYDYIINTPCQNNSSTYITTFSADNDTYVLGDAILTLGIVWRYKQAKERPYAEDMKSYELALAARYRRDRGAGRTLSIAPADTEWPPDGVVPDTGFGA